MELLATIGSNILPTVVRYTIIGILSWLLFNMLIFNLLAGFYWRNRWVIFAVICLANLVVIWNPKNSLFGKCYAR